LSDSNSDKKYSTEEQKIPCEGLKPTVSGQTGQRGVVPQDELISSEAERLSPVVGQVLDVTRMEEGRAATRSSTCLSCDCQYHTIISENEAAEYFDFNNQEFLIIYTRAIICATLVSKFVR